MENLFEIAAGSVAGRTHRLAGKNSHDAFHWLKSPEAIVAVVSDGCGSGGHSEVGAQLGARLITTMLQENIRSLTQWDYEILMDMYISSYLEGVRHDVLAQFRVLARAMGGSFSQTVADYFLFTVVGAVVMPRVAFILSFGDGFISLNNETAQIGPFPNNEPPYLGYGLTGSELTDQHPEFLQFQVRRVLPTESLQFLLIGTDGVKDFIAAEERRIPGKNELVGPLNQFWEKDCFFENPDMTRRRLVLVGRDITRLDHESPALIKEPGLLPDDTTILVIRRKKQERE